MKITFLLDASWMSLDLLSVLQPLQISPNFLIFALFLLKEICFL